MRGSPIGTLLIPHLVAGDLFQGTVFQDNNGNGSLDNSEPGMANASLFVDANNNSTETSSPNRFAILTGHRRLATAWPPRDR